MTETTPRRSRFLVVGVDGSESSRRAPSWALEEAALRSLAVRVVGVAQIHIMAPSVPGYPYADQRLVDDLLEATRKTVTDEVSAVNREGSISVSVEVLMGVPAEILTDMSKDAAMLVVGSRGRGGFSGLLLGSVSQQCVSHAKCPVMVVRPSAADSPG
ncbi:MAG: universal stress protein [Candidatus Dormibacteraeota bacterium]|nr:universal stress protein [Candidatus Dormibacteraeota bacterium]